MSKSNAQNKKTRKAKRTSPGQANTSSNTRKIQEGAPGAARPRFPRVGLADLVSHRQAWVCGYVFEGNGVDGAANSLYFATNTFAPSVTVGLVPGTSGGGHVPVLGSDARVGQTYIADIRKHFSRIRIKKCLVHFIPLTPQTATAGALFVAPVRGPGASGDVVVFQGATTAAPTAANTLGMQGAQSCTTWEKATLDLTPYIAGGTGPQQNEFQVSLDADTTAWGTGAMDMDLTCPCAFVVSGEGASAAGVNRFIVMVEQTVDLLDFIGGNVPATPEAFLVSALLSLVDGPGLTAAKALDRLSAMVEEFRTLKTGRNKRLSKSNSSE